MATQNFYALLGDDENDDPSALIAKAGVAVAPAKELKKQQPPPAAKLPTKPAPPAQAVRESQADSRRGRGGQGSRGRGRGSYGNRDRFTEGGNTRLPRESEIARGDHYDRSYNTSRVGDMANNSPLLNGEASIGSEESGRSNEGAGRGRARGRGRGHGYGQEGEVEERPRHREYERRSGTGRGNEVKRDGAGRGNWGLQTDQEGLLDNVEEEQKAVSSDAVEKTADVLPEVEVGEKQAEVQEEDKEMTLEEYEKVLTEKRKNLEALKVKERKVTVDKAFESMQLIEKKNEEVFLKLGIDKGKKKELTEKDDRARKPVNINEFLKPADGEESYGSSGRRGDRGNRGGRGGFRGGFGGGGYGAREIAAPSIEDPSHFPTLGAK